MESVFWPLIFIPFAAVIIFTLICMAIVFKKAGEPGWAVLVPFYDYWVMAKVGGRPGYMGLLAWFIGFVPVVGPFISIGLAIYISIGIAATFDRGIWFGLGLFFLPFIFYPILAFAKEEIEPQYTTCYQAKE